MARNTLAQRMTRLEQQKARLAEEEARLRDQERKQRTRRLIEAGGLVEKARLLHLDANTLLGALLALQDGAGEPETLAGWAAEGGKVFAREAAEKASTREPLVVVFQAPVGRELTSQLRALGLRWNKVLMHWEGIADHDTLAGLVNAHGASVRRLRMSEPAAIAAE